MCNRPYSYEGDELVFCSRCEAPVHQHCYGIAVIPDGDWFCETCEVGALLS